MKYLAPVLSVALLAFAVWHVATRELDDPLLDPPGETVTSPGGPTIAAAGIVETRTQNIEVSAPVNGVVAEVAVEPGQRVRRGAPLFRLDDRSLRAELEVAVAQLAAAQAELRAVEQRPRAEEVPVAEARVSAAEAELANRRDELDRLLELRDRSAVAEREISRVEHAVRAGAAALGRAEAELALLRAGPSEAELAAAVARVETARAQVARVETSLEQLTVRAPIDGEVLQVNARPGELVTAAPAQPAVLLGDTVDLHVRVEIDEHDIGRFRPEARAAATIRGQPATSYPLTFVRVEPFVVPKRFLTGRRGDLVDTRVLQIVYRLDRQDEGPPYVGQQVDVFIEATGE